MSQFAAVLERLWSGRVLAPIFLLSFCGCTPSGDLGMVTGTITLNGEPVEGVVVEFNPQGGTGSVAMGQTDANGKYEAMFTMNRKGASLGENLIRLSTADVGIDLDGTGKPVRNFVPAEYGANSTLVRTVEPGNNVIDIDMVSDENSKIRQSQDDGS